MCPLLESPLVALEDVQSWLMWQSQVGKSLRLFVQLDKLATSVKQPTCLSMDQAFAKCRTPTPTHEPWGLLVFLLDFGELIHHDSNDFLRSEELRKRRHKREKEKPSSRLCPDSLVVGRCHRKKIGEDL